MPKVLVKALGGVGFFPATLGSVLGGSCFFAATLGSVLVSGSTGVVFFPHPTNATTAIINRIFFMPATLRLTGSGVNGDEGEAGEEAEGIATSAASDSF